MDYYEQEFGIRRTLGPFAADLRYRLESADRGIRVTNEVELRPMGVLGVVAQLAGGRVKEAVAANLMELKRILESRK